MLCITEPCGRPPKAFPMSILLIPLIFCETRMIWRTSITFVARFTSKCTNALWRKSSIPRRVTGEQLPRKTNGKSASLVQRKTSLWDVLPHRVQSAPGLGIRASRLTPKGRSTAKRTGHIPTILTQRTIPGGRSILAGVGIDSREMQIFNRIDFARDRFRNFVIRGSLDGKEWFVVHTKNDNFPFGGLDGCPFIWRAPKRTLSLCAICASKG